MGKACVICGDPVTDGARFCSRECREADSALYRQHADDMLVALESGAPRPIIDWRIKGKGKGGGMGMITVASGSQWSLIALADRWRDGLTMEQIARLCDIVVTVFGVKAPVNTSLRWSPVAGEVSGDARYSHLVRPDVLDRWRREAIAEVAGVVAGEHSSSSFAEDIQGVLDTV